MTVSRYQTSPVEVCLSVGFLHFVMTHDHRGLNSHTTLGRSRTRCGPGSSERNDDIEPATARAHLD